MELIIAHCANCDRDVNVHMSQGKVINVQPGFLGWFLTKTHPGNGANSVKTILGLSGQGGNRYGSTLVLSNKNHVEVIIIFILQHGFCSTKSG